MKIIKDDIFKYWKKGYTIVIPTNGTLNSVGSAVMGAGLAKQIKEKIRNLPLELGKKIKEVGNYCFFFKKFKIITFPVKHNFWENADLKLIKNSCLDMMILIHEEKIKKIAMPKVGCGKGRLNWKEVERILEEYLDDRFIIVDLIGE